LDHLKVQRDGRSVTVEVTSDGAGLVSHAGSALLAQVADKSGLTQALSVRLADLKQRRSGHDPIRAVWSGLAVMLADGGDCLADIGALRDQDALFGAVASDLTAFRVVDRIASTPGGAGRARRRACPCARARLDTGRCAGARHDRRRRDARGQPFGEGGRAGN
jgi:hypothetical protein